MRDHADETLNPRERAMADVITRQAAIIGRLEERLREAEGRSMPGPRPISSGFLEENGTSADPIHPNVHPSTEAENG